MRYPLSWPRMGYPPLERFGVPSSLSGRMGVPPPPMWMDSHLWKHYLPHSFGMRAVKMDCGDLAGLKLGVQFITARILEMGKVMLSVFCLSPRRVPQSLIPGPFPEGYPSLWSQVLSGGYLSLWCQVLSREIPQIWKGNPLDRIGIPFSQDRGRIEVPQPG